MNDLIDTWLEKLRSGKYLQHDGALRNQMTNEFCCLGVLCDAVIEVDESYKWGGVGHRSRTFSSFDNAVLEIYLPPDRWFGFDILIPQEEMEGNANKYENLLFHTLLSTLNDHCGYNFEMIAQVIEKGVKRYDQKVHIFRIGCYGNK